MNVIIPLGGVGSRFQKEGYYQRPKPFIPVLGKPMILWVLDNLNLQPEDSLVIVYNPAWMNMDRFMEEVVKAKYPRCTLVELAGPTRGAAETVLRGLERLPASDIARPVLLADGDTFYTADIVSAFRQVAETSSNAVFCFSDTQPKPIYSYIRLDAKDDILEVKEKVKISDWANTGCYCFRNGVELSREIESLIASGEKQLSQDLQGEFYTSGVIATMLKRGLPFRAIKLNHNAFHVLGTPEQVVDFCSTWRTQRKLRVACDVEGTLFSRPRTPGDYSTCEPISRNIQFCSRLKAQGHHIIIHTEQSRARSGGVVALLSKHGIKGDELAFHKPRADFFVSDAGVDPMLGSLDRQLGCYPTGVRAEGASPGSEAVPFPESLLAQASGLLIGFALGFASGMACYAVLRRRSYA